MTKGTIRRALYAAKNLRKHYDEGGVITPRALAQRIVPPEEYGAISPSMEGVEEAVKTTAAGTIPAAQSAYNYITTTSLPQAVKDVGHVVGSMAESAKENPAEFIGGMMPVIGNIYAAKDLSQLKDKIQEARAAGNEQAAAQMEKMAPLAMAGVLAPFGGGAAARGALKSAERVAARELTPLGLYSHGAETAFGLPQAKGTPEQIAAMLQKQGVKPAELEGFAESFAGQPSITREQAAEFFKGRMPQVEETVLGQPKPLDPEYQAKMDKLKDESYRLGYEISSVPEGSPRYNQIVDRYTEVSDQINELKSQLQDSINPTKYKDYTLPGGENYREVLLKLTNSWKPEIAEKNGRYGFAGPDGKYRDYWSLNDAEQAAKSMYRDSGSFKSMHWNEPDVLAHIRMADRVGPNGEKILHVEEIQSDWAQKAQKIRMDEIKRVAAEQNITKEEAAKLVPQDYAFIGDQERLKQLEKQVYEAEDSLKNYKQDPKQERALQAAYDEAMKRRDDFLNQITDEVLKNEMSRRYAANGHGELTPEKFKEIKDAFKNDRTQMAQVLFPNEWSDIEQGRQVATLNMNKFRMEDPVKQQLERNLQNAYDRLRDHQYNSQNVPKNQYVANTGAWTDLALKRILKEAAEGGYDKVVWTPGAEQAKRYDLSRQVKQIIAENRSDGISLNVYDYNDNKIITPRGLTMDQVAEHVGKEAAEKIQAQFEASQKSGANTPRADLRGLDLVVGGEGMKGYYDKIVPTQLSKLMKKLDPESKIKQSQIPFSGKRQITPLYNPVDLADWHPEVRHLSDPEKNAWLKSKTDAEKKALWQQYLDEHHPVGNDVIGHSITITPKMRESILQGFPHYAEGGAVDKYPLRNHTDWEEAHDYEKSGGKLHYESPDKYLENTEPLDMGTKDKRVIQHFEKQMEHGEKMDPVAVLPDGHPNGRHRAHAAKKLGIKKIPVVSWPKKNKGGSIVDRALMITSKKA